MAGIPILVCADTVGAGETGEFLWRDGLLSADTTGFLADPRVFPTTHNYCKTYSPDLHYSEPPEWWDFDRYEYAYDDLKAHGHDDPKVWVTEFGWRTGNVEKAVPEATQAQFTVRAFEKMRGSGKVERAYSFCYSTNSTWPYNWLRLDNTEKLVVAAVKEAGGD